MFYVTKISFFLERLHLCFYGAEILMTSLTMTEIPFDCRFYVILISFCHCLRACVHQVVRGVSIREIWAQIVYKPSPIVDRGGFLVWYES